MKAERSTSSRVERRAATFAVATAVVLMAAKFAAYYLTGSAAIFSDALESIVNIVASGVALYAIRVAHTPPDAEHPYGHGKVEFLSAALEGGMICAAAGAIVVKAVHDLRSPELRVENLTIAIGIMILTVLVNGAVGLSLVTLGRRTGSVTLHADGKHLLADSITSAGALAALAIVGVTGWHEADPITALVLAVYLVLTGARMLKRSLDMLMDKQDPADQVTLTRLLDAHTGPRGTAPRICSYHKLRHRHTGRYHWVDFHIMVPAGTDVRTAHDIASTIEGEIERALREADATAHIEPCTDGACPVCATTPVAGARS